MDFKGKTVLITGGTRGIGRDLVKAFSEQHATVIFVYNKSHELASSLITEVRRHDIDIISIQCDVSDYEQVKDVFVDINARYPKIDVLINNAGIAHYGLFSDMSVAEWHNIVDTNMNSLFYVTREILPGMISNKSGSIINISSIWGIDGASCEVAYSTSKGGMNAFTKALSKEVGPSNVRVNAIACGFIETDMNKNFSEDEKQEFIDNLSISRIGTPRDVAELCQFLASDKSSYINGQIIRLDGGVN